MSTAEAAVIKAQANQPRPYVVLIQHHEEKGQWERVGDTHLGTSSKGAIKTMMETQGVKPEALAGRTFVAVPARSWQPASPKPKTGISWA